MRLTLINFTGSNSIWCFEMQKRAVFMWKSFIKQLKHIIIELTGRLAQLLITSQSVREVCRSIPGTINLDAMSPTACHRCDISSVLCCPGAKSREMGPATHYTFQRNSASVMMT